ncbi:hypothetical protein N7528_001157 [Penicillium herquei]|nr:hypothetical protein N7528_001157 [Penicillium herquei]
MDHTYLFCLIMGVPAMWSTRKLRSRFTTKAQNIVYFSGLAMYAIGLWGFFLRFLWETWTRTNSLKKILYVFFSEMQCFLLGLNTVPKALVCLAAVCYALGLCLYLVTYLMKGPTAQQDKTAVPKDKNS